MATTRRVAGELVRRRGTAVSFALGVLAGAVAEYVLDPERGRRRRRRARERVVGGARHASRHAAREARTRLLLARGRLRGLAHRIHPPAHEPPDDVGLAHKVESVLFRKPDVPKGRISVDAHAGRVYLRGELESPELIREIEQTVARIPDVHAVESLLHLPGTPAPHPAPHRR